MSQQQNSKTAQVHRRPNYLLVFLALALITALEVAVTYIPGIPLAPVLLTMTVAKAMLVILYFMHLKSDSPWYALIFFGPLLLLVVPMVLVMLI